MGKFLYSQNKTMELVGKQTTICAGTEANKGIRDIVDAYVNCEEDFIVLGILQLIQKGFFFGLLSNVYTLGVIAGKRQERAKKANANAESERSYNARANVREAGKNAVFQYFQRLSCFFRLVFGMLKNAEKLSVYFLV